MYIYDGDSTYGPLVAVLRLQALKNSPEVTSTGAATRERPLREQA